jgi:hypothetical protein
MSSEVCGSYPWKCGEKEAQAVQFLNKHGVLPVGAQASGVDVVSLAGELKKELDILDQFGQYGEPDPRYAAAVKAMEEMPF